MDQERGEKSRKKKAWETAMYLAAGAAVFALWGMEATMGAVTENVTQIIGYFALGFCGLSLSCMGGAVLSK